MDNDELLNAWQDKNKVWNFEGSTRNLSKLVQVLGYHGSPFGDPISEFLCDNPGAQIAIVEWIAEWVERNKDWADALRQDIGEEDEE